MPIQKAEEKDGNQNNRQHYYYIYQNTDAGGITFHPHGHHPRKAIDIEDDVEKEEDEPNY